MLTRATALSLLTFAACTSAFAPILHKSSAFAPQVHRTKPLTRRPFTEVPEALETARFVRVDPENTETKPVLLALGGLDGSPRVGARNWKRLGEWFDVRALVLDCVEINQCVGCIFSRR